MTSKANKKVANSLVAMSSAAVLAVYAAGYVRTRAAADRFAQLEDAGRARLKAASPRGVTEAAKPAAVAPSPESVTPPIASAAPAPLAPAEAMKPEPAKPDALRPEPLKPAPLKPEPLKPEPLKIDEPKLVEPPVAATEPVKTGYKDGTYLGWGHCRHGDIQAQVVIVDGRIASATIATCLTRYSCSIIDKLPPQVAQRQSPDVDVISGATQSGDAFYYAVLDALYLAK